MSETEINCSHKKVSLAKKLFIFECGALECSSCNKYLKYSAVLIAILNILLVMSFMFSVALSIQHKSWLPYVLFFIAYFVTRAFAIFILKLKEATIRDRHSFIWFVFLAAFIFLIIKLL